MDCTLVLLGSTAVDDPEADVILETIHSSVDERIRVVSIEDPLLVNALQRQAAVVLQKSIREGFGLTVTEAMWKGAAAIGGNVPGIRRQIRNGENGFLVETIQQTAERLGSAAKGSGSAAENRGCSTRVGAGKFPAEPAGRGLDRSLGSLTDCESGANNGL